MLLNMAKEMGEIKSFTFSTYLAHSDISEYKC